MRLANLYLTCLPVILSGILNMVFTKTRFYARHHSPMDRGFCLPDGKRLFGDNKSWTGFVSMIVLCTLTQLLCGGLIQLLGWEGYNDFYRVHANTPGYNLLIGALTGFVYMICELPNSFIKRRLDIAPGKTKKSPLGVLFFLIDQIDSLLGVMLVIVLFARLTALDYLEYLLVGGLTHAFLNVSLYLLKIRRNV